MKLSREHPVALVTGSGRRVGAVIARTLHAAGYNLALHCRHSIMQAETLSIDLERQRVHSTMVLQADLDHSDAPGTLVERVLAKAGRLDALVNNASTFFPTPLGQVTLAHWDQLMVSNARAPLFLVQAASAALRKVKGSVVNLADIYAQRPLADHPVYCMAKAALVAMTRSLALDLAPDVRVNAVAPGAVLWPEQTMTSAVKQGQLDRTPGHCMGAPEHVAGAVLWLLRDASFVTGQVIKVDGGRTLPV